MTKYEIFDYNDVIPTGIIFTDTSKASICKKLGMDDPYKIDVCVREDSIYIDYDGKSYCVLRKID